MANEIHVDYDSGYTLYFLVRNSAGNVNVQGGNTFEAYAAASIATYDHALTENGDGAGHYVGTFDTTITTAGTYNIQVFLRDGGAPADGDSLIGNGEVYWDGDSATGLLDAVEFVKNVIEGDATVDTGATPWQMVITHKDTDAELIRKDLKDVSGGNIAATTTVIGQQTEP